MRLSVWYTQRRAACINSPLEMTLTSPCSCCFQKENLKQSGYKMWDCQPWSLGTKRKMAKPSCPRWLAPKQLLWKRDTTRIPRHWGRRASNLSGMWETSLESAYVASLIPKGVCFDLWVGGCSRDGGTSQMRLVHPNSQRELEPRARLHPVDQNLTNQSTSSWLHFPAHQGYSLLCWSYSATSLIVEWTFRVRRLRALPQAKPWM